MSPANTPAKAATHAALRAAAARINERNARTIQRMDAAVSFMLQLVAAVLLICAGVWLLLTYFEPCAGATLCAGVVPFIPGARLGGTGSTGGTAGKYTRRHRADDTTPPPLEPPAEYTAGQQRVATAVQAAFHHGRDIGERAGYVQGWRWGWLCGLVPGVLAGALLVAGALKAGWLIGAGA